MTDWMATLKEAGIIARKTEADTLELISGDKLSLDHGLRLLDAIEQAADDFDELIAEMRYEEASLDPELMEAAEAIEDLWSDLTLACLNKIRALQDGR